jgi:glutaredoxin
VGRGGVTTITLYTRDGCHLCDRAQRQLDEARPGLPRFDLQVIDIESDPALHRLYLERIPVFALNGSILCELGLELDAVRSALTE